MERSWGARQHQKHKEHAATKGKQRNGRGYYSAVNNVVSCDLVVRAELSLLDNRVCLKTALFPPHSLV